VFVFQLPPPSGTLALLADFSVVSKHFFGFFGRQFNKKNPKSR
jgi:hypothetical protein